MVITGMPALTAASIPGCSTAASETEIRMPAGLAATAFLQLRQFSLRIVSVGPGHLGCHIVLRRSRFESGDGRLPVGQRHVGCNQVKNLFLRVPCSATRDQHHCQRSQRQRHLLDQLHCFLPLRRERLLRLAHTISHVRELLKKFRQDSTPRNCALSIRRHAGVFIATAARAYVIPIAATPSLPRTVPFCGITRRELSELDSRRKTGPIDGSRDCNLPHRCPLESPSAEVRTALCRDESIRSRRTPIALRLRATPPAFCTRAPFAAWPARRRSSRACPPKGFPTISAAA